MLWWLFTPVKYVVLTINIFMNYKIQALPAKVIYICQVSCSNVATTWLIHNVKLLTVFDPFCKSLQLSVFQEGSSFGLNPTVIWRNTRLLRGTCLNTTLGGILSICPALLETDGKALWRKIRILQYTIGTKGCARFVWSPPYIKTECNTANVL